MLDETLLGGVSIFPACHAPLAMAACNPSGGIHIMKVGDAIAEILKREGVEIVFGYPVNHVLEHAAVADIRPIIVRQERIGLHMADAVSRLSSGKKIGVFVMQLGPGAENSYGAVAQAYAESVPVLVMPGGYPRKLAHVSPNFNSSISMRDVSKSAEPINVPADIPAIFRRAFTQLRNGRGGPVIVEIPNDIWTRTCRSRWTIGRFWRPASAPSLRPWTRQSRCCSPRSGRSSMRGRACIMRAHGRN